MTVPATKRPLTAQELEWLAELDEIYEENPLQKFVPHPKQAEFLALGRVRTKMFAGGNRAGKSVCGIVDDLIQAVDVECLPESLRGFKCFEPPFFCRIVTEDLVRTMGSIETILQAWVPKTQLRGGGWDKAYNKQTRKLHFRNGSFFDLSLSYEAEVNKFGGVALHRVHLDEEPPGEKGRQIYTECKWRLADYSGQMLFTMTPLLGMSWTFEEIYERRLEPDFAVVQAGTEDNPHIAKAEILAAQDGLTKEEKEARTFGRFVHFKGKVYPEFDDDVHVVEAPDHMEVKDQSIIVGIDPGIRWTGLVWCAFDNDNSALVFESQCVENHDVEQVAALIRKTNMLWRLKSVRYVIDPSFRNRQATNAENVESAFVREGIMCSPGQNALEAGVFEVKRRLQHEVKGKASPMLRVAEDCNRLRWEIGRYRRDDKDDGQFAVVKEHDHCLDALRYVLMERPWATGARPVKERRRRGWVPNTAPPQRTYKRRDHGPLGAFS